MTFGPFPQDRSADGFGPSAAHDSRLDAPYADTADGFGGRGPAADGFGRPPTPLQLESTGRAAVADGAHVHDVAERATGSAGSDLPHLDTIQRAFGAHDVRGVRAHANNAAAEGCADLGARAFATGNDVAFASTAPDLHTAAHEAAHVVQQRAGVHLKDGLGRTGDPHERHADDVADAVVRGESAVTLLGPSVASSTARSVTQRRVVQRFGAAEHQDMGNSGSGQAMVALADGYQLPFGDVVALAGDHFASIEQMRVFALNTRGGRGSRDEIEYAREWKLGTKGLAYIDKAGAEAAQKERYYTLAANNSSHFDNPGAGQHAGQLADKAADTRNVLDLEIMQFYEVPNNAFAGYRRNHVKALAEAARAGQAKAPAGLDSALAADAFACHYLTDSFSGGHARTERSGVKEYWDARVPMFFYNLQGYMAQQVQRELQKTQATALWLVKYRELSSQTVWEQTLSRVHAALAKLAPVHFGDLVGLAQHDFDNKRGVQATVAGKDVTLMGDGHAGEGDERSLAVGAVAMSTSEIRQAFALGATRAPADAIKDILQGGALFLAETRMPVLDAGDLYSPANGNQTFHWRVADANALFADPHFVEALRVFAAEKASEVKEAVGSSLDATQLAALQTGVIDPMLSNPVSVIRDIIDWVPMTDGGYWGQDTDDNAYGYFHAAMKTPGGLESLTVWQRKNLIGDLMDGLKVWDDEEEAIWAILRTAPDPDAREVIHARGWGAIADALEGYEDDAFRARFPRKEYGS